jgi:biotin carboxylase
MALDATQGSGGDGVTVVLDNELAAASRARGERDPATSHCIFVQAFRQLERHGPQVLTTLWDGDRVFKVSDSCIMLAATFHSP